MKVKLSRLKSGIIFSQFILIGISGFAQISLDDCINGAINSYPVLKNRETFELIHQQELDNNLVMRYPSLSVGAQGKYQSDVVEFNLDLPFEGVSFPAVPHFQYNIGINASQTLFDGGRRGLERDLLNVDNQTRLAGLDVLKREIKESVQKLFLEILLKEKQIEVVNLVQSTIDTNIDRLKAAFDGGIVTEMDMNILQAEKIDFGRKLLTLKEARKALIQQLALLCKLEMDSDSEFLLPHVDYVQQKPDRFEYDIFNYKNQALEVQKKLIGLKSIPRLSAFGQAGYGRPGLNFMSDKWQDFYVVGLQFSWIPWDYKETRRKQTVIDLNAGMLENERANFDLQLQTAIDQVLNRIILLQQIIVEDEKMVSVRADIRTTMEKRLSEGVSTSAEYIAELNKEKQARLDVEKSKIDLIASKLAYQVIVNR